VQGRGFLLVIFDRRGYVAAEGNLVSVVADIEFLRFDSAALKNDFDRLVGDKAAGSEIDARGFKPNIVAVAAFDADVPF